MIRSDSFPARWKKENLGAVATFLDHLRRPVKAEERTPGPYPYYGANGQQGTIDAYLFDEPLVLLAEDGGYFGDPVRPIAYYIEGKSWVNNHAHVLRANKAVIDPKFLFRVLSFYDVRPFISGTTRSKLTKSDASKIPIPLPPLAEQRRIVEILDQADALRKLRREADTIAERILPALFYKMFGDPVRNPMNWPKSKVKDIADINPKPEQLADNSLEVSFVPMADVNERWGKIVGKQVRALSELKKGYTYFQNGDVLFAKITPCMENGKAAIARYLKNGIGFGSTEFHVVRPKSKATAEFLYGLVRLEQFRLEASSNFTGTAGQQRVPAQFIENYPVPVPPTEIQNKFGAFVRWYEEHVTKSCESSEALEVLFDSLLHRAFTGELTKGWREENGIKLENTI